MSFNIVGCRKIHFTFKNGDAVCGLFDPDVTTLTFKKYVQNGPLRLKVKIKIYLNCGDESTDSIIAQSAVVAV